MLPVGKKSRQRAVVGDSSGTLRCFTCGKSDEIKNEYSVVIGPKPVAYIDIFEDQAFVASGDRVMAFTKKGKNFFTLETNASEQLTCVKVITPFLFMAGEFGLTGFKEATEKGFFMAPDKINEILISPRAGAEESFDVFLACQDRVLRLLRDGVIIQEIVCPAALSSLTWVDHPNTTRDIAVGSATGGITCLGWTGMGLIKKSAFQPLVRAGTATSITTCDISKDGFPDLIVARDDGTIEVLSYEMNSENSPISVWKGDVGELITGTACGMMTNVDREDIVVSTFSGKVVSFAFSQQDAAAQAAAEAIPAMLTAAQPELPPAPRPMSTAQAAQSGVAQDASAIARAKIDETMAEIRQLETVLAEKKLIYAKESSVAPSAVLRAVTSTFTIREKVILEDDATLTIAIEIDTPLDFVALATTVMVELIEIAGEGVTCAQTPASASPGSTARIHAVYRAIDVAQNRLQIHVRPLEGEHGDLVLTVVPRVAPRTAQVHTVRIKPLSLHRRTTADAMSTLPPHGVEYSSLKITGGFNVRDAHSFLFHALPEVPEKITAEEGKLVFKSVFTGTSVLIGYSKGEIALYSNNVSTLATLKEFITKVATERKIAIKMSSDIRPESTTATLNSLHPKMEYQSRVARQMKMVEALREIEVQEQSVSFLSAEYQHVLAHAQELEEDVRLQPKRMQYLTAVLTKLYSDRAAFNGEAVSTMKLQHIQQCAANYNPQELLEVFTR